MLIKEIGTYMLAKMENPGLSDQEREELAALANEELAEELTDMIDEADALADPVVLFGICAVTDASAQSVTVGGVKVENALVAEKLGEKKRCFPYIATCGTALENWSLQYKDDLLTEYWADEIKKKYLRKAISALSEYLNEAYHLSGYRAALNPGSRQEWPVSGQQELFAMLGGVDFVREHIGVTYTDSFLMLPTKSVSGITFESETFYENCQYCPLDDCPGRRAPRIR